MDYVNMHAGKYDAMYDFILCNNFYVAFDRFV